MTRSPLFYPLHRADSDAGGAADLQTDIMRFMAILALCLVAIFALVQSIPLLPEAPATSPAAAAPPPPPPPAAEPERAAAPTAESATPDEHIVLRHPKWTPTFAAPRSPSQPLSTAAPRREAEPQASPAADAVRNPTVPPEQPAEPGRRGFTLRFESDLALTRLVAAGQVGLYAIGAGHARRMTVSESRISFWDASTPGSFHEMEAATVPRPVIDALARAGVDANSIAWGVTLPGKMRRELDTLMHGSEGGALVIGADGELRLETS